MLPAVQMLVSQCGGGQGWGKSPLGSGLPLLHRPFLALSFLWGGLCAFNKGQSSLPGSSGKMGMTIPRSCHIVRELGTGRGLT